jgi:hypothetical protein
MHGGIDPGQSLVPMPIGWIREIALDPLNASHGHGGLRCRAIERHDPLAPVLGQEMSDQLLTEIASRACDEDRANRFQGTHDRTGAPL